MKYFFALVWLTMFLTNVRMAKAQAAKEAIDNFKETVEEIQEEIGVNPTVPAEDPSPTIEEPEPSGPTEGQSPSPSKTPTTSPNLTPKPTESTTPTPAPSPSILPTQGQGASPTGGIGGVADDEEPPKNDPNDEAKTGEKSENKEEDSVAEEAKNKEPEGDENQETVKEEVASTQNKSVIEIETQRRSSLGRLIQAPLEMLRKESEGELYEDNSFNSSETKLFNLIGTSLMVIGTIFLEPEALMVIKERMAELLSTLTRSELFKLINRML